MQSYVSGDSIFHAKKSNSIVKVRGIWTIQKRVKTMSSTLSVEIKKGDNCHFSIREYGDYCQSCYLCTRITSRTN